MIDERFSAAAFEKAGYGSEAAGYLSKELATEILNELDKELEPAMLEIIAKLNAIGHQLSPTEEQFPDDKTFIEPLSKEKRHGGSHNYKFLVALNIGITTGYP